MHCFKNRLITSPAIPLYRGRMKLKNYLHQINSLLSTPNAARRFLLQSNDVHTLAQHLHGMAGAFGAAQANGPSHALL